MRDVQMQLVGQNECKQTEQVRGLNPVMFESSLLFLIFLIFSINVSIFADDC